jgi:hypothetical protein
VERSIRFSSASWRCSGPNHQLSFEWARDEAVATVGEKGSTRVCETIEALSSPKDSSVKGAWTPLQGYRLKNRVAELRKDFPRSESV